MDGRRVGGVQVVIPRLRLEDRVSTKDKEKQAMDLAPIRQRNLWGGYSEVGPGVGAGVGEGGAQPATDEYKTESKLYT